MEDIILNITKFCRKVNFELYDQKYSKKEGGYLTILNAKTGAVIAIITIGKIPAKKQEKYFQISLEKARRVFFSKKSSSFLTRNPEDEKYAGAIKSKEYIYSFSGHSEENDEVITLMLSYYMERYIPDEFKDASREKSDVNPMRVIGGLQNSRIPVISELAIFMYGQRVINSQK